MAAGALPPAILFERAMAEADDWRMPRLYVEEAAGLIVGSGAFKAAVRNGWVEIGYGVSAVCQGRGYGTAGARLLVAEAFSREGIGEVCAEVAVGNPASRRVVEKAGFSLAGEGVGEDGPFERWCIWRAAWAGARLPKKRCREARENGGGAGRRRRREGEAREIRRAREVSRARGATRRRSRARP